MKEGAEMQNHSSMLKKQLSAILAQAKVCGALLGAELKEFGGHMACQCLEAPAQHSQL